MRIRSYATLGILTFLIAELRGPRTSVFAQQTPAAPVGDRLHYQFELLDAAPRAVRVSLRTTAPDASRSAFSVQPQWGGEDHIEREVTDLEVRDSAGKLLVAAQDANQPHRWTVDHAPKDALTVSYLLRPPADRLEKSSNQYRPILTDDLFHLIGQTGLIAPDWIGPDRAVPIELTWRGFDKPGWSIVSSFGPGPSPAPFERTISEFRQGLFLAGRLRVEQRRIGQGTLAVALYGDKWTFGDAAFADLVKRVVRVEREFFRDFNDPWFLVSLIPTRDDGPQSFSLGGTGLTDCFALFCSPNMTLDAGSSKRMSTLHLLAHEYFHNWNGRRIQSDGSEPEERLYWFSEGFTDFYAARLLYAAGLITAEEWVEQTNEGLRAYWLSPARDANAERIRADFWKSREVQDLPYKRGAAVALALDWEIRKRSEGKRDLDDFMRELLEHAVARGERTTSERLFARMESWTSTEFARRIRAVVEDGAMLELPADLFSPSLAVELREASAYSPGFDVTASARDRRVSGVERGGLAEAAGLRDGMKVLGLSVHHGDTSKPIVLTVADEGGERKEIAYAPRGPAVTVPTVRLVSPPEF